MRLATLLTGVLLCSVMLIADEKTINFDEKTDFSRLKTFSIREAKSDSERPELNNPLFLKRLAESVRTELKGKGLEEISDKPDLFVDLRVDGADISFVTRDPDTHIPGIGPGGRGGINIRGSGPHDVRYTQGTIDVGLTAREANLLVWQGIYRNDESNGSKLAQKLPSDAKKLIAQYPPKKK
jgi:hypothetical protein